MNDTITPRQQQILAVLAEFGELSRQKIGEQLVSHYRLAQVTVNRDLKKLLEQKLIVAMKAGPQTAYRLVVHHPYLEYVDLPRYFAREPDERELTGETFAQMVTTLGAQSLLEQAEINHLNQENEKFTQRTASLEPGIYAKELERFTIDLAWKSAKIEGNTYSLLETETLLKNNQLASGHSMAEAQMLLNHQTALQTIFEQRLTFGKIELIDILNIHKILTANLGIEAGIRRQGVGITGTNYRPLDNQWQLREALEQAIDVINQKTHPVEKALLISAAIIYLQPFVDGNKRTARLAGNAVLLAYDFAALSYRSVEEIKYKQAALLLDERHNFYWYKKLFLEQLEFSWRQYFAG